MTFVTVLTSLTLLLPLYPGSATILKTLTLSMTELTPLLWNGSLLLHTSLTGTLCHFRTFLRRLRSLRLRQRLFVAQEN